VERLEVKTPPGLADCFWHHKLLDVSGWLELKFCEPSNDEYKAGRIPKLRTAQPLWLNRQARQGVPAGILLRVGTVNPVWMLWAATGHPEWSNMVNSTSAIANASSMWCGAAIDVEDFFYQLIQRHRDHGRDKGRNLTG
jgi:hypothetical protein